ncbi:hypothetical protein SADUNF_Sadunf17G0000900 [Salix dunnii]|uniref:Uncharacterized protein n=1 Tax=Salix dunnii TaxID=1413687 RepID=A0A835J4T3_9ROSI|nr:hypothetical protein SADUNF_Sadunf17G0000900 [Salix dunnii]
MNCSVEHQGIGAETARVLAKRGARLVLPPRNLKAAEDARARILSENPDADTIVLGLDLSSLNSVRNFVSEFESLNLPLNLLMSRLHHIWNPPKRKTSLTVQVEVFPLLSLVESSCQQKCLQLQMDTSHLAGRDFDK